MTFPQSKTPTFRTRPLPPWRLLLALLIAGAATVTSAQERPHRQPAPQTEELRRSIAVSKTAPAPPPAASPRARSAKPSLAVLPFTSLGASPDLQLVCDGIDSDIISALSRFRALSVIARNSSFAFRDSTLSVAEIGAKLGLSYLVTGSLRVNYLKPASVAQALELRARIVEHGERKSVVACSVRQGSVQCATAEVTTVRVKGES